MKSLFLSFFIILFACGLAVAQEPIDLLKIALDSIGMTRSDLGFSPKQYWSRFPDAPYKIKAFDDLFAEPLKLYDYGKSFGGAVRKYCDPDRLDSLSNNLYNLVYFLGVERKTSGFRSYGANLIEPPGGETPFIQAIENLYLTAGAKTSFYTFGKKADWPDLKKNIESQVGSLPLAVRSELAGLVENLREAIGWRQTALRNVTEETRRKVFYIRDLSETQGDGMVYYPAIDDAARTIDFESMCYAALKVAAASEKAEVALKPLAKDIPVDFYAEIPTPYGKIILGGREDNNINGAYSLLIVDFGGDDSYTGPVAATTRPDHPLSVLIDLAGNDTYTHDDILTPAQGSGILGVGLLYDAAGSDRYIGKVFAQGSGFFGIGILFDKSGGDNYKAETSAQGAGYFGIGLIIDADGDDNYYLYGDGQGMGGIGGGIGCLADYAGDDIYTAEPSSAVVNRGDYHSEFSINVNQAQGAGVGRRGDGSDGHSWAGGLGVIVDIKGNDQYISGNWSLGCGYWFGTGICYDGEGDDLYKSVYFTQASGAHFCNGVLIDEAGDDKHILYETAGAAFGFGWDFTNALFIDRAGNDEYSAKMISYGVAQIRSFALFFDMSGADKYIYRQGQQGFGAATYRKDMAQPSELLTYMYYAKSAGIFIDAGGTDNYLFEEDGKKFAADIYRDGTIWMTPSRTDSTFGFGNFGIGIDADSGLIPELNLFDRN